MVVLMLGFAAPKSVKVRSSLIVGKRQVLPASARLVHCELAFANVTVVAPPVAHEVPESPTLHFCQSKPVALSVTVPSPLSVYDRATPFAVWFGSSPAAELLVCPVRNGGKEKTPLRIALLFSPDFIAIAFITPATW